MTIATPRADSSSISALPLHWHMIGDLHPKIMYFLVLLLSPVSPRSEAFDPSKEPPYFWSRDIGSESGTFGYTLGWMFAQVEEGEGLEEALMT